MLEIEKIVKNLHELNFGKNGIIRPKNGGSDYSFTKGLQHEYDGGPCCCDECRNITPINSPDCKHNCRFTGVSHGTHMLDFLTAHGVERDKIERNITNNNWSHRPVMFVMENPANNKYETFDDTHKFEPDKHPAKKWYWLSSEYYENDTYVYPNYFSLGEYGQMIYSLMQTFHIANGYLTNMVKCGIGYCDGDRHHYINTGLYNRDIVNNCIDKKLTDEITALRGGFTGPIIIFAFSANVYNSLSDRLAVNKDKIGEYALYLMPHPANRLANDYRRYVLFGKTLRALMQNGFYDDCNKDEILRDLMCILAKREEIQTNYWASEKVPELANIIEHEITASGYVAHAENKYIRGFISYSIKSVSRNIVSFIIKYKTNKGEFLDDEKNQVVWLQYVFSEGISMFRGKASEANDEISEEQYANYFLYDIANKIIEEIAKKE